MELLSLFHLEAHGMEKERADLRLIELVIAQDRKVQFQLFELTKRTVCSLAFRILNDEDTLQKKRRRYAGVLFLSLVSKI